MSFSQCWDKLYLVSFPSCFGVEIPGHANYGVHSSLQILMAPFGAIYTADFLYREYELQLWYCHILFHPRCKNEYIALFYELKNVSLKGEAL